MTTRTPLCMLAVALAMSLAPASQHAAAADTREAARRGATQNQLFALTIEPRLYLNERRIGPPLAYAPAIGST